MDKELEGIPVMPITIPLHRLDDHKDHKPSPTYKHDCEYCTYLGMHKHPYDDHFIFDLYLCTHGKEPEILARHGEDGAEFGHAAVSFEGHPDFDDWTKGWFQTGVKLAKAAGLIGPQPYDPFDL